MIVINHHPHHDDDHHPHHQDHRHPNHDGGNNRHRNNKGGSRKQGRGWPQPGSLYPKAKISPARISRHPANLWVPSGEDYGLTWHEISTEMAESLETYS